MLTTMLLNNIARLFDLLMILVAVTLSESALPNSHECVHDRIAAKDLPVIKASVGSHGSTGRYPRSTGTNNDAADRTQEGGTSPEFTRVRITPHFVEPLDVSIRERLIDPSGPLFKSIAVMSSLLLVRPLTSNLTLTPSCQQTYIGGINNGTCAELSPRTECGIFSVPDQFLSTVVRCDTADDSETCHEEGPNGEGVAADFLLFVGTNQSSICGRNTFAFSSSCAKDAYHRPTAGYVNLCAKELELSAILEEDGSTLYNILLHELIHALGFTRHRLSDFHDGNLNFYDPRVTGTYNGQDITGLQSPKVLEVGRAYFGCADLPFVPLENNGESSAVNSHWEARVLHHESMVAYISRDYSVLSNFTLAFFEDSGWYEVDYSSLKELNQFDLLWGKDLGCPFVLDGCSKESYPYLCDPDQTYQCTYDLISRGRCTDTHTFFDGCPVVLPGDELSSCIVHHTNSTATNAASEMFGQSSMCIDIGQVTPLSSTMVTFPVCYNYQYNSSTDMQHDLTITAYNETVFCNSSSVNRTAYEILSNVRLKVYCPHGNQLNVRLALAGQTTYLVERSNTNDVQNTPQEESRPTWIGIFSVVVAVLVVIIGFGLPLLLITIKTVDCPRRRHAREQVQVSDPNVISINLPRTSSNLTEIVFV